MSFVLEGLFQGNLVIRVDLYKELKRSWYLCSERVSGMALKSTHAYGNPIDSVKACSIKHNTFEE